MCQPLVSVIVPNYNHASFLSDRLNSIFNQTYDNFEVIILDDCSTDKSREIIEQYRGNPKVSKIVYNSENSGSPFRQWDKGIAIANGKYIWIAESDDRSDATILDELVRPLDDNPQTVISFCQSVIVLSDGTIVGRTDPGSLMGVISGSEFNKRYLLGENIVCNASAVIFSKEAMKRINRGYLEMSYCGDWYIFAQIASLGDVYISRRYLNYFVRHNNTATFKPKKQSFYEQKLIYEYIKRNQIVDKDDILRALRIKAFGYLQIKNSIDSKEDKRDIYRILLSIDKKMRAIFFRMKIRKLVSDIFHLIYP